MNDGRLSIAAAAKQAPALVYFQLALTALFWSGAFFAGKMALERVTPLETAAARFVIAAIILLFALRWKEGLHQILDRRFLWRCLALGAVGVGLYNVFFFHGLARTAPLNASLIVASNPAMTALLVWILRREGPGLIGGAGIVLSFAGVAVVVTEASLDRLLSLDAGSGDLLIVLSSFCWAIYSVTGQRIASTYSTLAVVSWSTALGALLLLPLGALESAGLHWLAEPEPMLAILYMAALATALAFTFWYRGVRQIGASQAAIFINLVPLFSFFLSTIGGEAPLLSQIAGGAAILAGVFLTSRPRRPPVAAGGR